MANLASLPAFIDGGSGILLGALFVLCAAAGMLILERALYLSGRARSARPAAEALAEYLADPTEHRGEVVLEESRALPRPLAGFFRRLFDQGEAALDASLPLRISLAERASLKEIRRGLSLVAVLIQAALALALWAALGGLSGGLAAAAVAPAGEPLAWAPGARLALSGAWFGAAVALCAFGGFAYVSARASAIAEEVRLAARTLARWTGAVAGEQEGAIA